jgi:2,3-bisphosphoglycerate-dependent phosphoglycerate mutase
MGQLILLRHGQSAWNAKNLFTGWVDIPLTEEGMQEARRAGEKICQTPIDAVYTSTLVRAHMTLSIALLHHSSGKVPVFLHGERPEFQIHNPASQQETLPVTMASELNERMYGELQGFNKKETAAKYGEPQVHLWRRSFDVAPPGGESLAMTAQRTIPYFQKEIATQVAQGKNVLIVAHGNSLRSIVMHLESLSEEQVLRLELATGEPLFYRWEAGQWRRR